MSGHVSIGRAPEDHKVACLERQRVRAIHTGKPDPRPKSCGQAHG
jgi:hypothetical protein